MFAWKNKEGLWLLPEGLSHSPTWTHFEFTEDINQAWIGYRPPVGVSEEVRVVEVEVKRTVTLKSVKNNKGE